MHKIRYSLLPLLLIISPASFADIRSTICDRDTGEVSKNLFKKENQLAFNNDGGMLNMDTGTCWWHSRFTRSAGYLAYFNPDAPKPDAEDAKKIIHQIRRMDRVVEVPGYANLMEFSAAHQAEIQKTLNEWMAENGILNFSWVKGLAGKYSVKANVLRKNIEELYQTAVVEKDAAFAILQLEGIAAHSWLILDMQSIENGYRIFAIDSNISGVYVYVDYHFGDTSIRKFFSVNPKNRFGDSEYSYGDFVLYPSYNKDLNKISNSLERFCGEEE